MVRIINILIWVAISFAILWVFWTGNIIDKQPDREQLIAAIWAHIGFAMVWIVPILLYVTVIKVQKSNVNRNSVIAVIDNAFWSTLGLLFVSGFLTVWSRGSDLKVFDWFVLPTPVDRIQSLYVFFETSHGIISKALIVVGIAWALTMAYRSVQHLTHQFL